MKTRILKTHLKTIHLFSFKLKSAMVVKPAQDFKNNFIGEKNGKFSPKI